MTSLLVTVAGAFFAYALYIAALGARHGGAPQAFVDAGAAVPSWVAIFGGAGVMLSALNLHDHILLVASYGLQASHLAIALVLAALVGALVRKRLWLAARIAGLGTAGELMGVYFGSVAIRLFLLAVLFLFSVPFAAYLLAELGDLAYAATEGAVPREMVIWTVAFFLFLSSALGGWRATAWLIGAQGFLLVTLLVFAGASAGVSLDGLAFLRTGIAVPQGVLADRVPGVIQFSAGIGKEAAFGGIWTTVAILSFAVALTGAALSPGFAFLGITTDTRRGFAFEQVWMTAGLVAGALLFVAPVLAAELGPDAFAGLARRLAVQSPFFGVCLVVLVGVSLQVGTGFFAASGAHVATIELVKRYVLPGLDGRQLKLATRIALAVTFLSVAAAASFAPLAAAVLGALALPLAAQLLPAYLGLCWLPWISRSAVLTGMVIGSLVVLFTEAFGLILFERLFVHLPWGRWPLTIHSAAWGLAFNLGFCLLASIFTRSGAEREVRQRLHDEFAARHATDFGGRAARGARWSLILVWAFLALGPGAILGNRFFSQPVFSGAEITLGLPSLMVWQVFFWLVGVLLVWWLAYPTRMSVIGEGDATRRLDLGDGPAAGPLIGSPQPAWITRALGRIAERR